LRKAGQPAARRQRSSAPGPRWGCLHLSRRVMRHAEPAPDRPRCLALRGALAGSWLRSRSDIERADTDGLTQCPPGLATGRAPTRAPAASAPSAWRHAHSKPMPPVECPYESPAGTLHAVHCGTHPSDVPAFVVCSWLRWLVLGPVRCRWRFCLAGCLRRLAPGRQVFHVFLTWQRARVFPLQDHRLSATHRRPKRLIAGPAEAATSARRRPARNHLTLPFASSRHQATHGLPLVARR
jgi:hypothetical protein